MNQYELFTAEDGANVWSMSVLTFDTNGDIVERNAGVGPTDVIELTLDTIELMAEEATWRTEIISNLLCEDLRILEGVPCQCNQERRVDGGQASW